MKKPGLIIDIGCDHSRAVETSVPTTIENPVYSTEGVLHYVVDHTPALIANPVYKALSNEVSKYLDTLIEEKTELNEVLNKASIIKNGVIIDQRINDYQNRLIISKEKVFGFIDSW